MRFTDRLKINSTSVTSRWFSCCNWTSMIIWILTPITFRFVCKLWNALIKLMSKYNTNEFYSNQNTVKEGIKNLQCLLFYISVWFRTVLSVGYLCRCSSEIMEDHLEYEPITIIKKSNSWFQWTKFNASMQFMLSIIIFEL